MYRCISLSDCHTPPLRETDMPPKKALRVEVGEGGVATQAARAAVFADEVELGWLEAALNEERPPPEDTLKWFCLRMMPMLEEAPTTPDQALSYQWGRLVVTCQARALVHAAKTMQSPTSGVAWW